jgi:hypothetical protein
MIIRINQFGSLWDSRDRLGRTGNNRSVWFNTTGIMVGDKIRHRWTNGGDLKFFSSTPGFSLADPAFMVGKNYDCYEFERWNDHNRLTVKRVVWDLNTTPMFYANVLRTSEHGNIDLSNEHWKAQDVLVLSVSQHDKAQEIMVLAPRYAWIRSEQGTWYCDPQQNGAMVPTQN